MKTCHIVFQTHWDREWYYPFETYRYRLIHVIKRVLDALDQNEIDKFVLDGQTLPLDDFLEVAEIEDQNRILAYIKQGKIIVGPWYIAMDEFLVQGESIIRNLEIGISSANSYKKGKYLGYLPDTFGHIGQMPQILSNFNIEDAMMWRGIDLNHSEFIWEGTDGTKLFTVFLSQGYYQEAFNHDQYVDIIKKYVDRVTPLAQTNHILFTAGGDHLMPIRENLKNRMDMLNKNIDGYTFVNSDYLAYIQKLKENINIDHLDVLKGELRKNTNSYILPNVLSTRSYLKILNQDLEDQMLAYIEPLTAIAYLGKKAPYSFLKHIWKTILQNQPHDSICGCSVDDVHIENEMRAKKAFQMIESVKKDLRATLSLKPMAYYIDSASKIFDDDQYFSLFNPNPFPYRGYVKIKLYLHEDKDMHKGIKIKDDNANIYEAVVIEKKEDRLFDSPLDYPPAFRKGYLYDVVFEVDQLKALSITPFEVIIDYSQSTKKTDGTVIENEYIKVMLTDKGTLNLIDKLSQVTYENWHGFYSSLDAGDSYNYSKPKNDMLSYAKLSSKPKVVKTTIVQKMFYQLTLTMPKALDDTRSNPSLETVDTIIDVELSLYANQSQVHTKTHINQKGQDQRLRVTYPLNEVVEHSYSDQSFEIVKRQANRKEIYIAQKQKEVDVVVDPSLSLIYLANKNNGIEFFHKGLHEYQTTQLNHQTSLEVTLIRSVSHLSRDDFDSRGGAAGPNLETKDAQCLRKITFDYAFGPITDIKDVEKSFLDAKMFRKPVIKLSGSLKESTNTIFSYDNHQVDLTSIRLINEHQIEVRLVNLSETIENISIESQLSIKNITLVKMNREIIEDHLDKQLSFKPFEIKTLLLSL
jgi:mannosylglycerate hydrolase